MVWGSCGVPGVRLGLVGRTQGHLGGLVALLRTASVRFLGRPHQRDTWLVMSSPAGLLTASIAKTVGQLPCKSVLSLSLLLSSVSGLS